MKLICPGCGATASAETMTNDEAARKTLGFICKMDPPLPVIVLPYLSLFRPEKSALGWSKALRLAQELAALVGKGHVQIEQKPARPCPARFWAQAMEEMLDRRERITRPLKNHNYLRDVAYTIAEREDAAVEKRTVTAERSGSLVTRPGGGDPEAVTFEGLNPDLVARLPESVKKKYGM